MAHAPDRTYKALDSEDGISEQDYLVARIAYLDFAEELGGLTTHQSDIRRAMRTRLETITTKDSQALRNL